MRLKIVSCAMIFFYSLLASAEKRDTITVEGLLYSDSQPVSIQIIDGKISEVRHLPAGANVPQVYIAPGLTDLQVNGYMGVVKNVILENRINELPRDKPARYQKTNVQGEIETDPRVGVLDQKENKL